MVSHLIFILNSLHSQTTFERTYQYLGDEVRGIVIRKTTDNGYIIGGLKKHSGYSSSDADLVLIKTDSLGFTEWYRVIEADQPYNDIFQPVIELSDGNYLGVTSKLNSNDIQNVYLILK